MQKFFLGIDGGGTKTKATLFDEQSNVIGKGEASGSNINILGIDQSFQNLSSAALQAINQNIHGKIFACFCLSGVNFPSDVKIWEDKLQANPHFSQLFSHPPLIINDIFAVLRAGTIDPNAIVLISGTGSNSYGRNDQGQQAKTGGMDYILSDEGSGYAIGEEVLKAVIRAEDGRIYPTQLTRYVFDYLNIQNTAQLYHLVYRTPWTKRDISSLAQFAHQAAQQGDLEAARIIHQAGLDLSIMAKALIYRLNLRDKKFTVVTAGSIFHYFDLIVQIFQKEVLSYAPDAQFVVPQFSSSEAAAFLAGEHFSHL